MAYTGRLVTIGGGLGGLGTAIAQNLRSKGAHLALLYAPFEASRRDEVLSASYGSTTPDKITTVECDITSEESVSQAFEHIKAYAASTSTIPSILINAAGYVSVQPLTDTSADEARKNIIPNLIGPMLCSQAWYKLYMASDASATTSTGTDSRKPPGRIVSISSQAAHVALDGHGAYCASKAGLNALTRCMALEWGGDNVTANTVSPTVVLTELGKRAWADQEKRRKMEEMIPSGRFAVPDEVGVAVEFLCRDDAGMCNGGDVRVDGGFTIR